MICLQGAELTPTIRELPTGTLCSRDPAFPSVSVLENFLSLLVKEEAFQEPELLSVEQFA